MLACFVYNAVMIVSRTPLRVSFFGGGTDYPDWYEQQGGAVLATTINKYVWITMRRLPPFFRHNYRIVWSKVEEVERVADIQHPAVRGIFEWMKEDQGLEVHYNGDLPARSGMGSSSSFTVGIMKALKAFRGEIISRRQLAKDAIHVEQKVLKEAVGSQDQISAAYGGFNHIVFHEGGGFNVTPVLLPPDRREALQNHLMLFFTGISRFSVVAAQDQIEQMDANVQRLLRMRRMVDEAIALLRDPDASLHGFGELLHESWTLKQKLSSKVSGPQINELYTRGREAGAIGGKLLGAGGGGFLLFFVEPEKQEAVRLALSDLTHVPFSFESAGSQIVIYEPEGLG